VINNTYTFIQTGILFITFLLTSGCATLDGPPNPDDPFESFNRSMFAFNEGFDKYALKPAAEGYNYIMPDIASKGVSNFFSNLDDIVVFFNQLLQFKIHEAVATSARFVFNTTIGLLGFIDVATDMDLPKHEEDFGQTLAVWGVPSGPYLVLPILGPQTIRDSAGLVVDWTYLNPVLDREKLKVRLALTALKIIDIRAGLIQASNVIDETAPDKYSFIRDAWKQRRKFLIYDGHPPDDFNEDELFKDEHLFDDRALHEEDMKSDMQIMDSEKVPAVNSDAAPE
jgi:phospholipid-binding lipoprotein MlaA